MAMKFIFLMLLSFSVASTSAKDAPAYMSGIWSLGETANCQNGQAWVFMADGYYVEMNLPDGGSYAMGLWRDEGNAIAYTHSHMPFPDMLKANTFKRLDVLERSTNKIVTKNYKGLQRIFHRCANDSVKKPAGQKSH